MTACVLKDIYVRPNVCNNLTVCFGTHKSHNL
jgi:hypothetical protein